MSRFISFNRRKDQDAVAGVEIEVVLVKIEHPDIDEPIRVSSDSTKRLSIEPLEYCTWSSWAQDGSIDEPYKFVMMGVTVPDESEDVPSQGNLVLQMLDSRIGEVLTSTIEQATVHMAIVLASSPDLVEAEWLNLKLTSAESDDGVVQLNFDMDDILEEPWPSDRTTKERFPGQHT
ncbi:DUF1833 family protein [Corticibacterium sp. UT-5YL-CI-8]|nr:DUF1833 family protein [Tianweitania sp. UT-5YL-CI-8]